jgi:hypothetical protein
MKTLNVEVVSQRGSALIISLIMLLLLTLVVSGTFTLSGTNIKAVGNMQARDEAVAAANSALNQVLGSPFTVAPAAESIEVDINNDTVVDYTVSIATPACSRATIAQAAPLSSVTLPVMGVSIWNTVWDLEAEVTDPASGAEVTIRTGVRVLLTQAQCDAVCPPAIGEAC